jgi:hypothetical protein
MFTVLLNGCKKQTLITDLTPYHGVWANADCELVQTEKYTLLFERSNDKIIATLRQIEKCGDTVYSNFFESLVFDTKTKDYEKTVCNENQKKMLIGDYLQLKDGKLEIFQSPTPQKLHLIEKLDICPAYEMPFANTSNIGSCLQYWQLGVFEFSLDKENIYIEIGTNKHAYIFGVFPNMIYCRAARIKHNNNGSVFAQNIRLMINDNTKEKTAEMEMDNLKISQADIDINNSLFKPDMCSFEEGGIYWSFISCTADTIKLNGCGEIYTYVRESVTDETVAEWFEYKPY